MVPGASHPEIAPTAYVQTGGARPVGPALDSAQPGCDGRAITV